MATSSTMIDGLQAEFSRQADSAVAADWLRGLRADGTRDFAELGLPGTHDEAWKYTSTRRLADHAFLPVPAADLKFDDQALRACVAKLGASLGAAVMVLVDGHFVEGLSTLPDATGLEATALGAVATADPARIEGILGSCLQSHVHGFAALNTALWQDGVVLRAKSSQAATAEVCVLHWSSRQAEGPALSQPRHLVVVEKNAALNFVEYYAGQDGGAAEAALTNCVVEIILEDGARLNHTRVIDEPQGVFHIARTEVQQARDSFYDSRVVTLGGRLVRNELAIKLQGTGAACHMGGVCVLGDGQHADHHTWVDHAVSHTNSVEGYKGVFDGKSRGVFTGHVLVRPDAQKIDAQQSNRNLLLSDQSVVEARPQLEIYADDVKASHGATIGRLDAEQLFYMRSRGLGEAEAKRLLTFAFADEPVASVEHDGLREVLSELILAKIQGLHTEVARIADGHTQTEDLK